MNPSERSCAEWIITGFVALVCVGLVAELVWAFIQIW